MKCLQCGHDFVHINKHYAQSDCIYPSISNSQLDVIYGLLLGDGCMDSRGRLVVTNTNKKFLDYLNKEIFPEHYASVRPRDNCPIPSSSENAFSDVYVLTLLHTSFKKIRKQWYSDDGKIFPTIEMNNTKLKYWYVCDGTLLHKNNPQRRVSMEISCTNSSLQNPFFSSMKITPNYRKTGLAFDVENSVRFFKENPKPIVGFKYKWTNEIFSNRDIQEKVIKILNSLLQNHTMIETADLLGVDRHTIHHWKEKKTIPELGKFKRIKQNYKEALRGGYEN